MITLEQHQKTEQALTLIRCGFRTKIIEHATGLRMKIVRQLYKEIWGCSPTPGMLPQSVNVVKSWDRLAQASLFADVYHGLHGSAIYRQVDIAHVLRAYRAYAMLHAQMALSNQLLDINAAWVIARDLRAGTARLTRCKCGYPTMLLAHQHKRMLCPICQGPVRLSHPNCTIA